MIRLRSNYHLTSQSERGFTIVELMIATTVLSTILLLVTAMMLGIGRLYYKGISQSQVQENVRNLTDEISQHLELSDKAPDNSPIKGYTLSDGTNVNVQAYCIGDTRYNYILDREIGSDPGQIPHVLWRDNTPNGGCAAADPADLTDANLATNDANGPGTELLDPHSRLMNFCISATTPPNEGPGCPNDAQPNQPFVITIGIAYGADDLLCDNGTPDGSGDCDSVPPSTRLYPPSGPIGTLLCKTQANDQFCATASLSTVVGQRLTSN